MEYIGEDNKPHRPVMVHRALFGSIERFFGVLIEHYAGAFPLWLAPVQVAVLPITDRINEYAEQVAQELQRGGIARRDQFAQREDRREDSRRADAENSLHARPRRPRDGGRKVAVRERSQGDIGAMSLEEFIGDGAATRLTRVL